MHKRPLLLRALGVALMLATLACNFPGLPEAWPLGTAKGTATPELPGTQENQPGPGEGTETTPQPLDTPMSPDASPTVTPQISVTPSPTPTATPTPTPTATPEPVRPGPPLVFQDPAWELITWQRVPNSNDWQGTIRVRINGGTPPYRAQLENQSIVNGLDVPARWRICAAMPATIRVWSADGQSAQTTIWVPEVGCANN